MGDASQGQAAEPDEWLPGLERFSSDPLVAAALQKRNVHQLHDALLKRRRRSRSMEEKAALDRLLSNRRAFAMAGGSAPTLRTFNGIGQRIYGKSDQKPDGSYIGTLFGTILYLPLWPVSQYVIMSDGTTYFFHGEVPLSRFARLWRWAVGLGALALIGWWAMTTYLASTRSAVQLINALDQPVVVSVAGKRVELPSGTRVVQTLPVGKVEFRTTTSSGRAVETIAATIPSSTELVAYNVLGAAPLALVPVVYARKDAAAPAEPNLQFLGGEPFVFRRGIQYVMVDPPHQVKLSKYEQSKTQWHAFVGKGGWQTTVRYLRDHQKDALADELEKRVEQFRSQVP